MLLIFFTGVVLEQLNCYLSITKILICQLPPGGMFPRLESSIAQNLHTPARFNQLVVNLDYPIEICFDSTCDRHCG